MASTKAIDAVKREYERSKERHSLKKKKLDSSLSKAKRVKCEAAIELKALEFAKSFAADAETQVTLSAKKALDAQHHLKRVAKYYQPIVSNEAILTAECLCDMAVKRNTSASQIWDSAQTQLKTAQARVKAISKKHKEAKSQVEADTSRAAASENVMKCAEEYYLALTEKARDKATSCIRKGIENDKQVVGGKGGDENEENKENMSIRRDHVSKNHRKQRHLAPLRVLGENSSQLKPFRRSGRLRKKKANVDSNSVNKLKADSSSSGNRPDECASEKSGAENRANVRNKRKTDSSSPDASKKSTKPGEDQIVDAKAQLPLSLAKPPVSQKPSKSSAIEPKKTRVKAKKSVSWAVEERGVESKQNGGQGGSVDAKSLPKRNYLPTSCSLPGNRSPRQQPPNEVKHNRGEACSANEAGVDDKARKKRKADASASVTRKKCATTKHDEGQIVKVNAQPSPIPLLCSSLTSAQADSQKSAKLSVSKHKKTQVVEAMTSVLHPPQSAYVPSIPTLNMSRGLSVASKPKKVAMPLPPGFPQPSSSVKEKMCSVVAKSANAMRNAQTLASRVTPKQNQLAPARSAAASKPNKTAVLPPPGFSCPSPNIGAKSVNAMLNASKILSFATKPKKLAVLPPPGFSCPSPKSGASSILNAAPKLRGITILPPPGFPHPSEKMSNVAAMSAQTLASGVPQIQNRLAPARIAGSVASSKPMKTPRCPSLSIQDKWRVTLNNICDANLKEMAREFDGLIQPTQCSLLGGDIARRIGSNSTCHPVYLKFLDNLYSHDVKKGIMDVVSSNAQSRIRKLIESPTLTSLERDELKCLGSWLGRVTLARGILPSHSCCSRKILFQAYENGKLASIVPYLTNVIAFAKGSNFRWPHSWLVRFVTELRALMDVNGLKLNIVFAVEVLCRDLGVRLEEIPRVDYGLRGMKQPAREGNPDFKG